MDFYDCNFSIHFQVLSTTSYHLTQAGNETSPKKNLPIIAKFRPPKRDCFHPGTSVLSRDQITFGQTKKVTSNDMITAMMAYIWPKVTSDKHSQCCFQTI